MQDARTVIINSAGSGSRFGGNINKSLVPIMGRKIIEWQLMAIPDSVQIVVGLGYQSELVYETVLSHRPDAIFSVNQNYRTTGTGFTLAKSANCITGLVTSLDGDLVVAPDDLSTFIYSEIPQIGITKLVSRDPVVVDLEDNKDISEVTRFFRLSEGETPKNYFEWSGLLTISSQFLTKYENDGHVYQALDQALPMKAVEIRCAELDYPQDFEALSKFIGEWYL